MADEMTDDQGYRGPSHRTPRFERWPDAEYDAALHLLDRQVVDCDGRLVAKVDDVELTVDHDGRLVPTALLVGLPALLPRLGRLAGPLLTRTHARVYVAHGDRVRPSVIDMERVHEVTSEVHLDVERAGLLRPREDAAGGPERFRLGQVLGLPVHAAAGTGIPSRSRVLDLRRDGAPDGGDDGRQVVTALVVGRDRPGALLGYDRSPDAGPRAIAAFVRWLHRHARVVELGRGVEIDREAGEVRIGEGASCRPLLG